MKCAACGTEMVVVTEDPIYRSGIEVCPHCKKSGLETYYEHILKLLKDAGSLEGTIQQYETLQSWVDEVVKGDLK